MGGSELRRQVGWGNLGWSEITQVLLCCGGSMLVRRYLGGSGSWGWILNRLGKLKKMEDEGGFGALIPNLIQNGR